MTEQQHLRRGHTAVGLVLALMIVWAVLSGPRQELLVVLIAALVVNFVVLRLRLRRLDASRDDEFAAWAEQAGMAQTGESVDATPFAVLRQGRGLVTRRSAVSAQTGGRVHVFEWTSADHGGQPRQFTSLVLSTAPTGSQLWIEPVDRGGPKFLSAEPMRISTGYPQLSEVYAVYALDRREPPWLDGATAQALAGFARWGAVVEVRNDRTVVFVPALADPSEWSALRAAGAGFVEAVHAAVAPR